MRKNIKTKTVFIGIAWMLIFLHESLPHNHSYDTCLTSHSPIHNESCEEEGSHHHSGIWLEQPDNHTHNNICHFSANLFLKIAPDILFTTSSIPNISSVRLHATGTVACIESDCNGPPLLTSLTLRGPPIT